MTMRTYQAKPDHLLWADEVAEIAGLAVGQTPQQRAQRVRNLADKSRVKLARLRAARKPAVLDPGDMPRPVAKAWRRLPAGNRVLGSVWEREPVETFAANRKGPGGRPATHEPSLGCCAAHFHESGPAAQRSA